MAEEKIGRKDQGRYNVDILRGLEIQPSVRIPEKEVIWGKGEVGDRDLENGEWEAAVEM